MSKWHGKLIGALAGGFLIAACGGGGDGGTGPGGGGGPTGAERTAMASALNAAAVNAEAAGDGFGIIILKGAAAMMAGGLTVTAVSGVTFTLEGAVPVRVPTAFAAGNGWAFGVELAMVQGQQPQAEVGVFEGAVVVSGTDIAYGFGLVSQTPGFVGSSFGAIWNGPSAGWAATSLSGIGRADSIIGGDCTNGVPAGLGISDCTRASLAGPGFFISASPPINFPGNTAAGSKTMAFGPPRLRGAQVVVDCQLTSYC